MQCVSGVYHVLLKQHHAMLLRQERQTTALEELLLQERQRMLLLQERQTEVRAQNLPGKGRDFSYSSVVFV